MTSGRCFCDIHATGRPPRGRRDPAGPAGISRRAVTVESLAVTSSSYCCCRRLRAAPRAGLPAGAPRRGRCRDPRLVRALRLGRPRPGGRGARPLARRRPPAAPRPDARHQRRSTASCSGRSRRRAPPRARARPTLVGARDRGRTGRGREGGRGGRGRPRLRGARARTDPPHAEGFAAALLRRAARRLGRVVPGRGRGPRAALLDRVQPRGRRHAARPADGDLGPRDRHRARVRGRARRHGTRAPGHVPGQGPRDDAVRGSPRRQPPGAVRRHEEQHGERPRKGDAQGRARARSLLARRRLARGGDGRPSLDAPGLGGGGEARGPGRGRGKAGLEADPGPAPLRLPRGLRQRERRAARVRRRPAAARTAGSSGTPRTRDARTSGSRAAAASARGSRCPATPRRATCRPCACAPTRGCRAAARSRCRGARAWHASSASTSCTASAPTTGPARASSAGPAAASSRRTARRSSSRCGRNRQTSRAVTPSRRPRGLARPSRRPGGRRSRCAGRPCRRRSSPAPCVPGARSGRSSGAASCRRPRSAP